MPFLPWYLKLLLKLFFARLPFSYKFWKKIGIFQHGKMETPKYSCKVFLNHIKHYKKKHNKSFILELGPGDSLATSIIAYDYGFYGSYLVDVGDFATRNLSYYKHLESHLLKVGVDKNYSLSYTTLEEILKSTNSKYYINGLHSLKKIPSNSVDFIFSNSVIQHVKKDEFVKVIHELHRVMKPNAICSHRIDLKDMLGGSLNHLRFSSAIWESSLFLNSGFYTNRLRFHEIIEVLEQEGFTTLSCIKRFWESIPINKNLLSRDFRNLTDEDLLVSGFDIVLKA